MVSSDNGGNDRPDRNSVRAKLDKTLYSPKASHRLTSGPCGLVFNLPTLIFVGSLTDSQTMGLFEKIIVS
jgi:hypothetical protein